jgi:hypothetical protein
MVIGKNSPRRKMKNTSRQSMIILPEQRRPGCYYFNSRQRISAVDVSSVDAQSKKTAHNTYSPRFGITESVTPTFSTNLCSNPSNLGSQGTSHTLGAS